ncbi:MAG: PHB depolymerase family esterase [Mycobacteriales bacterium]
MNTLLHGRSLAALLAAIALALGVAVLAGTPAAAVEEPWVEQRLIGVRDGAPVFDVPVGAVPDPVTELRTPYTAYYSVVATDGHRRTFRLHVPRGAASGRPLLTMLHGLSQSFDSVTAYTRYDALAAAGQFAVVYPGGVHSSWNAGRCCGPARALQVDDQAAVLAMTRLARAALSSDPHRLYLGGFSNGGMMALSLACRSPQTWAGVLVVGAAHTDPCRPDRAVPLMQVHGTGDRIVPYGGTRHSSHLGSYLPGVAGTQALWRDVNARQGARTLLITVRGGGHDWPQGRGGATSQGIATPSYDTSGHGWNFLAAQRRATPAPP